MDFEGLRCLKTSVVLGENWKISIKGQGGKNGNVSLFPQAKCQKRSIMMFHGGCWSRLAFPILEEFSRRVFSWSEINDIAFDFIFFRGKIFNPEYCYNESSDQTPTWQQ